VTSAALRQWKTDRATRLDRLLAAHRAVRGVNRRWITDELNHSLILRLASEFQGYARDLHEEASQVLVSAIAPNDPGRQTKLRLPYLVNRRLSSGNADAEALKKDFWLFGLELWTDLEARYPARARQWRRDLVLLNAARNGLAHDDAGRLASIASSGWTTNLPHVLRWWRMLDALAKGMDHVVGDHLKQTLGVSPW
jgi:hypothetical protein